MKINMKKLSALLLAAALLLCAACALEEKPADSVDLNPQTVVASVGGQYDINRGELMAQYESAVSMYAYYGQPAPSADADVETLQDSVLGSMVLSKILQYKAVESGIALDEAEQKQVEADVDEQMQSFLDSFTAQAESEGAEDPEARAIEIFNEQLIAGGFDMDMDGYRAYVSDMLTQDALITKLEEAFRADISVTDEEVQAYYDNLLEIQKADYDETPANFQSDAEAYVMSGGNPIVYVPEGYMRVKTITVSPETAISADYTTLRSALDELEAEFGRLSLEGENKNAARLGEIKTVYAGKKAEADALYESYIKDAREKIHKAYAALQEGKSFDEALETYGEDDMYKTYPLFREKGILMRKEGETKMDAKLVEAALALEPGAYSEIIQLDDMFYIISPVGDEKSGTVALADIRDAIEAMALNEKAETAWITQQEEWNNDTSLVVYHEEAYRDIGKAVG